MHSALFPLLIYPLLSLAAIEDGVQFTYRGTLEAERADDSPDTRRQFQLTLLFCDVGSDTARLYWTLSQDGPGGWSWVDRFGQLPINARWQATGKARPALLVQRDDGRSVVPIFVPLLATKEPLAAGREWSEQGLTYQVRDGQPKAGSPTWAVTVANRYGHQRTVWVEKASPLVAAAVETVFLGQGIQHQLRYQLTQRKQLSGEQRERQVAQYEALLHLRKQIGAGDRQQVREWNSDQIRVLQRELPGLGQQSQGPLSDIVQAAIKDAKLQKGRAGALAALRSDALGKKIVLNLEDLRGQKVTDAEVAGHVTVLHFWEYRDAPLQEPYGQVAYLDYIHRRRKESGLRLYGVVVNQQLEEPAQRRRAILSARKFKSFMNLSYPVLVHDGRLLETIGDPRVTGAKLPLFLVLDANGKIIHYHVGHYEVSRDRGLEQLDAVIQKALDTPG